MRFPRSGRLRAVAAAMTAATLGLSSAAWAAPATEAEARPPKEAAGEDAGADVLEAPQRDPNDTPFMKPLHGGARPDGTRVYDADHTGPFGRPDRFRLTVQPIYASLRVAFIGRASSALDPKRGGGASLEMDARVWRPIWIRFGGSFTAHPVRDEFQRNDDDELIHTAPAGMINIAHAAASLVYTMDAGRLHPLLEVGLGPLWARTPEGLRDGQNGQACQGGGVCDFGLLCEPAQNICQPATSLTVHGGFGLDAQLAKRWSVGASLRYFAFLSSPNAFPIYLQAGLRLGLRL